jgi:hypothetical protein
MLVAWLSVSTTLRVKSKKENIEAEGCAFFEMRLHAMLYLHQVTEGWKGSERIGEGC